MWKMARVVAVAVALSVSWQAWAGDTVAGDGVGRRLLAVVAGDSIAQGYGLAFHRAVGESGWRVVNAGRVSTGLARTRGLDWVSELSRMAREKRPDLVILSFGANDAGMPQGGATFGTGEWEEAYAERVRAAVSAASSSGARVVWTTLPRMGREPLESMCEKVRRVQSAAAAEAGAIVAPMSAAAESPRSRLRARDGVHFTLDGYAEVVGKAVALAFPDHANMD